MRNIQFCEKKKKNSKGAFVGVIFIMNPSVFLFLKREIRIKQWLSDKKSFYKKKEKLKNV